MLQSYGSYRSYPRELAVLRSMKAALFSSHSVELLRLNCSACELRALAPQPGDVLEQLVDAGEER